MNKTSNPFIKQFLTALNETKNPIYLIENEIKQIEHFTSSKDQKHPYLNIRSFDNKTNSVFDGNALPLKMTFNESFFEYNAFGKINSNKKLLNPTQFEKTVIEFSEYYSWLKNELDKYRNKKVEKSTVTHKQKLLTLHYLGLSISDYDNNKIAKLLYNTLGLGYDNTRKWLPLLAYRNKTVRTESNLKSVKLLFESAGLEQIAKIIEKDIENLK